MKGDDAYRCGSKEKDGCRTGMTLGAQSVQEVS